MVGLKVPHTRQFTGETIDVELYVKSAYEHQTVLNSVQVLQV